MTPMGRRMAPLSSIRVLDLSTLLPGPLATRLLADAGADVVKIERPGGEDLKRYAPLVDGVSILWRWLNRGKRIVELDLKTAAGLEAAEAMIAEADVLIEQFRPGVMGRLGLDPAALRDRFPDLVICSITGYGQDSQDAGHDLNYQAEAGLLGRLATPGLPATLTADIAGGAYPAVINILLALRRKEQGGGGCHLDIAMTANLAPFLLWPLAELAAGKAEPAPSTLALDGGSPRYGLYRTADGGWLAVAALEDGFWQRLTEALGLPLDADRAAVAAVLRSRPLEAWLAELGPLDVCVTALATVTDALARGRIVADGDGPRLPIDPALCG